MRVATEILEDVLRTAERLLGVDDPIGCSQRRQVSGEGLRLLQGDQRVVEVQRLVVERPPKLGEEQAPEQRRAC